MDISRRSLLAVAPATLLASDAIAQSAGSIAAPQGLLLQPGVHRIDRSTTLAGDVMLMPGARFDIASGAVLTLTGDFVAPRSLVFSGVGRVDLNRSRAIEAYPEWWGARDDGSDCILAIEACLAAHPVMRLGAHSYFVSRTVAVERSNQRILGSGERWLGPGSGTRIVMTGPGDVMRLGTMGRPASVNDHVQGLLVSDLQLTRASPAAGSGHNAPSGLRARFILFSEIRHVDSAENVNGFAIAGAVRTHFKDCSAFRSPAGGTRSSSFRGFSCDGTVDIGLAGGNASIFLTDCLARTGGDPRLTENVGMLLDGAFADTFVGNFETAAVAVGIRMTGKASGMSASRRRAGHADVRIVAPVLDQCTEVGIEVSDTSDYSLIDVTDPYVACAPRSRSALSFNGSRGMLTVRGGQLLGWVDRDAGGNATAIDAANSDGLDLSGVKILGYRRPVRMSRCRDLVLDVVVSQPEGQGREAAVVLTDCSHGRVAARVKGAAGAYAGGVAISGSASRSLTVEASGIEAGSVGGDAARVRVVGASTEAVAIRR